MVKRRKSMMDTITHQKSHSSEAMFGEDIASIRRHNVEQTLHDSGNMSETMISIKNIHDNENNTFAVDHLLMLIESIRARGILQPLVVMPLKNDAGLPGGEYEIKSGSRRFAAVSEIRRQAQISGDDEEYHRFDMIPCKILPAGATEDEIEAVVVETNTTARQITVADVFRNFDVIFARDENGSYKYLPENGGTTKNIMSMLQEMGFSYQKSSVNEYVKIYFAHDQRLKGLLENGVISKRDALVMAGMSAEEQTQFVDFRYSLSDEEFRAKINEYKKRKKDAKAKVSASGAEALAKIDSASKQVNRLIDKNGFAFSDSTQKSLVLTRINRLRSQLDQLEKIISEGKNL